MKEILKKLYLIIILSYLFIPAACISPDKGDFIDHSDNNNKNNLVIWALSDIQPRRASQRVHFETAVNDTNRNAKNAYIAINAGDIIQWSNSADDYSWYVKTREKSLIKFWYEIAGNHDHKDFKNYLKYIKLPLHYSVKIGNILILLLSDENKKAETEISNRAFNWWKKLVISNQDRIIITVTHGYLKQSGLFGSLIPSRNIRNSGRFADVLKKYKVDIWICGHTHLPHYLKGRITMVRKLKNTLFINVSAIRDDPFMSIESNILIFKRGSDRVLIRSRNHKDHRYNSMIDIFHHLGHKFRWDGSKPLMKAID